MPRTREREERVSLIIPLHRSLDLDLAQALTHVVYHQKTEARPHPEEGTIICTATTPMPEA